MKLKPNLQLKVYKYEHMHAEENVVRDSWGKCIDWLAIKFSWIWILRVEYINGTPELASGLRVVGLCKVNSVYFVCLFILFGCFLFCFAYLLVNFDYFWERERTCSWVGRKMGRASGSWEREKIMVKIYSMKSFKANQYKKLCLKTNKLKIA